MVLALVEHVEGEPLEESLQMLTLAREIAEAEGESVHGVAFGDGVDGLTDRLEDAGLEVLYMVSLDGIDRYAPIAWAASLEQLADETDPAAVLAAGTDRGNEVLAHIGARNDLPVVANCLSVEVGETYTLERQRWGGSLIEHARLRAGPKVMSVALHELPIESAGSGAPTVESFTPELTEVEHLVTVDRFEESAEEGISLTDANVVIGGGRGVGNAEDFDKLEELAELIGAAVGSSRAAVNEGWRPHDDQIGQTGAKISPELYIAAGISGAVQHMVGCKGSKHLLAINTDPEAGIIQKANWAVLGDLHEVIPAITEEIRRRQGE